MFFYYLNDSFHSSKPSVLAIYGKVVYNKYNLCNLIKELS